MVQTLGSLQESVAMTELELLSARLRRGSSQQRALTWLKLVSLGESGLEGEQVGNLTMVAC